MGVPHFLDFLSSLGNIHSPPVSLFAFVLGVFVVHVFAKLLKIFSQFVGVLSVSMHYLMLQCADISLHRKTDPFCSIMLCISLLMVIFTQLIGFQN